MKHGDLIREARKEKGLSQSKLAQLLNINQHLLSAWELNKKEPSEEICKEILKLIENLDQETLNILRKHRIKRDSQIQNQIKIQSKTGCQRSMPNEAQRRKRLPFLYFDLNKSSHGGKKGIALFSGIGGLSLGFKFARFEIAGYVEIHDPFRKIFEANFPEAECLGTDITNITDENVLQWKSQFGDIDCLFGGPPCQGFSLAGKRDRFDKRNQLYSEFARIASVLKPKSILMENVSLMTSMKNPEGKLMDEATTETFEDAGFICCSERLRAEDYGVPQSRHRFFMIGIRKDLGINKITFPCPTHRSPGQKTLFGDDIEPHVTFWEAAGDLESLSAGQCSCKDVWHKSTPHPDHVVKMLECVPEGFSAHENPDPNLRPTSGYNTTYKRIKWDEPCSTISTNFNMISGCRNVHPSDTRAFTVREAMRVQTFPDSFKIFGKMEDVRKGIGNAVPPLLAMKIANHIDCMISSGKLLENSGQEVLKSLPMQIST